MNTIAAIHVGRRALGLDEDTARDLYEQATGKRSLKAMSDDEHKLVLAALSEKGFKPASKGNRKGLTGPYAKKLQALWIAGWNLGLVRNREDKALLAFVKRQTGLEHTQFLHDAKQAARAIEALKAWLAREGGVDWSVEVDDAPRTKPDGYKIAFAQARLLEPDSPPERLAFDLRAMASLRCPNPPSGYMESNADWIPIMNVLGERVRETEARR